jgi:hypothetical protein
MSLDQQDRERNAGESGWQPQPQPPIQPKVRFLRLKSHALTSVVLAGFLILTGCSTGNPAQNASTPRPSPTPAINCETASMEEWLEHCETAAPEKGEPMEVPVEKQEPYAGLNEPFQFFKTYSDHDEVEEWQVTLTKVSCGVKAIPKGAANPKWDGGDEYPQHITAKPASGEEFCLLYWDWKNVGKTPASTTNSGDILIGDERFAKSNGDDDIANAVLENEFGDAYYTQVDVNPRKSTRSVDVYSVPAGEMPRAVLFPMATVYEDSAMVISTT